MLIALLKRKQLLQRKEKSMGNELDELTGPTNPEGRDVNVIDKQLAVKTTASSKVFEISLWVLGILIAAGVGFVATGDPLLTALISVLGVLPGVIFIIMKINALAYLRKLVQRIQANASQIDNYLEQRVIILQNLSDIISKSVELDKDVMKSVAALRSGTNPSAGSDTIRNESSSMMDSMFSRINVAFEAYPELKAQDNIAEAIRQNAYLQKEITAARTLYNDSVETWNQEIYSWPTKQIVAAKEGYTTRIPFIASQQTKDAARGRFFN
jgi:LemA protein